MTRLNISKAREEFPEVLNRAAYGKERTIVSRRGKDLAAVIPMDDLRLLERLAQKEMDRLDLKANASAISIPSASSISISKGRPAMRCCSVAPSRYSMTMKARPSCSPTSCIVQMFG